MMDGLEHERPVRRVRVVSPISAKRLHPSPPFFRY